MVNNPSSGGGGGSSNQTLTTNDINSINYNGQKLEHELDQLTLAQNTIKARTEGLTASKLMVSNGAGLLSVGSNSESSLFIKGQSNDCSSNPPNTNTFNNVTCDPSNSGGILTARQIQIKPDSTTAAAQITFTDLAGNLGESQVAHNSINGNRIRNSSIDIGKMKNNSTFITTASTGAVTNTMLAGSIASTKLADNNILVKTSDTGSVTNTMLAGSIALSKIANNNTLLTTSSTGAVTNTMLAGSIASTKLADNNILVKTSDTGSVTNTMLAGSIATTKLAEGSQFLKSITTTDLPTGIPTTNLADGTLFLKNNISQNILSGASETKLNIINNNASNVKAIIGVQKTDNSNQLKSNLQLQANDSGTTIQAGGTATDNLSIVPASGTLAMTIGGIETRVHNNLKILGSMSGAARSDNKDYVFKTLGSTGVGSTLLLEDIILKPVQGEPSASFNPTNTSLLEISTTGVTNYKNTSDFLSKPGNANPTAASFVEVNPSGTLSYKPSSMVPLPGGAFPGNGVENFVVVNPAGTSYTKIFNYLQRPGGMNPTDGTSLVEVTTGGTLQYKRSDALMVTNQNQTFTGTSGSNAEMVIRQASSDTTKDSKLQVDHVGGGSVVSRVILTAKGDGTANLNSNGTIEHQINGTKIFETKSDRVHIQKQLEVEDYVSIDYSGFQTTQASLRLTNGRNTGGSGANETDIRQISMGWSGGTTPHTIEHIIATNHVLGSVGGNKMSFYINNGSVDEEIGATTSNLCKALELSALPNNQGLATIDQLQITGHFKIPFNSHVPASSTSVGFAGHVAVNSSYLFICVGVNLWKRIALQSF